MKVTTSMRQALVLAVAATAVVAGTLTSTGGSAGGEGNTLSGTWKVTVIRPAPLPPITSLQAYADDGSVVESASDGFTRTPAYGSWERVGGHLYAASSTLFRFDLQSGAVLGSQKIDRTIRLSPDGRTFAAIARATTYDLGGNVLASFRVPSSGERLPVDRIPDEP